MKTARIALLPGDGVGPEVVAAAVQVLEYIPDCDWTFIEAPFGIQGINTTGSVFPDETRRACEEADAVLLGAVGGPAGNAAGGLRPEAGLLALRKHFGVFANLRPVKVWMPLIDFAPVKAELLHDVDILFVRELVGGVYFGTRQEPPDVLTLYSTASAYDTMAYSVPEVARIAKVAFEAARLRGKRLVSVDKANVLASSRLWRRTIDLMAQDYSDIEVSHQLVDSFAMQLVTRPKSWDVVVTENMFGDILSDEASVLAGSLGMLPSASLSESNFGIYEPIHGSAPDIAGKGIANPIGTILSAAMLLRYSLGLEDAAQRIEQAVEQALLNGTRTADIISVGGNASSTSEFTQEVLHQLTRMPQ